jgi:PIN domain nuclease of toxin-antitoxin system
MSEIIILDTHIWFWFINQEFERFPSHWKARIETANRVAISPVSCFEIALAQQRKRLQLPCPTDQWFQDALTPARIEIFPLTPDVATCAVNLSPIHKDPFDRLIIATALIYQANLASVDGVFSQYSELDGYLMQ